MKGKKGFSLIEALIAVSVLAIVVSGILVAFTSQINFNKISKSKSIAIALAEDKIEELLSLTSDEFLANWQAGAIQTEVIHDLSRFSKFPIYGDFRRETQVLNSGINPNLYTIIVTVEYGKTGNKYAHRVVLSTMKEVL